MGLLSEVPCFCRRVVYQGELGEGAYKVCRSNERATGEDFLREADGETQSDHAMFLGILRVKQRNHRATPPEGRFTVFANV